MEWDRRTFLKTLLTWGISQAGLEWFSRQPKIKNYYQTLATPTPRKLALLVGINDYSSHYKLKGCVTDVERQRELLIYRFGFASKDILTLTEEQGTRERIEQAFTEHLIQQAKAGDIVLFHFSGYGNYVKENLHDVFPLSSTRKRGLVPKDGIFSTKGTPTTNDLLEETLLLLSQSLATDKLTMVLDTSHQHLGRELEGNLQGRSFPYEAQQPSPEEITFQTQLREKLKAKNIQAKPSQIVGTLLRAAQHQQVATEIMGNGFSTGLFTYLLTQCLWQATPTSKTIVSLENASEHMFLIRGQQQQPQLQANQKQPFFTYYLLPVTPQGAEGVIVQVEEKTTATIKLTGLPLSAMQHYGLNSCFKVVGSQSSPPISVQLYSCDGLTGKVRLLQIPQDQTDISPLEKGQLLQETLRVIPKTLGLTVALDKNLERIERVDATSAFASMKIVSSIITAGEPGADCLLGRQQKTLIFDEGDSSKLETEGGYGLFFQGGIPVPNTFGQSGEAIKSAVERLQPALKKLLAIKWWRLTLNEGSSELGLGVTLKNLDKYPSLVLQRQTLRKLSSVKTSSTLTQADFSPPISSAPDSLQLQHLPQLPQGSRLQCQLENRGDCPIYYLILGVDASGQTTAYLPPQQKNQTQQTAHLSPGETRLIPFSSQGLNWTLASSQGWGQMMIVGSKFPFTKTLETLAEFPGFKLDQGQIFTLEEPLKITQSLLADLNTSRAFSNELAGTLTDSYVLDSSTWATLSLVYQVV
ncbi:MAG: caspase family protein [cyanobacterium endosymbiont of Rhopalodia musculus]|uniref:caspase family protein n=1 Tax=cyanobacterium endosymbiont of Epithemia clementina EcSB TaxID=3034674 RepID=UPI00247FB87E|nr:caspase family protein [cyanobacterium endosymbiont of Epithemia clementina EcSB]WGT67308.1 caspase family protein [cyanobacterium endosymbiont of Epithemia clementina EcSB]